MYAAVQLLIGPEVPSSLTISIIMLRSMKLGGIDEALAEEVDLYSVLDVPFSWEELADDQFKEEAVQSEPIAGAASSPGPQPATPPLPFTSSSLSPMCMPDGGRLEEYLEPPLPCGSMVSAASVDIGRSSSSQMQDVHPMMKVTGLGQLARLIELG